MSRNQSRFESLLWTNSLNYNKTIQDVHNINVLLVQESNVRKNSSFNASSNSTVTHELENLTTENLSAGSNSSKYVRESYLARLNYNYDGKYIFAASIRQDASSRFGPQSRWGTFPSVALGWRISEESFLAGVSSISNLKLRASWGVTGNDNIGDYRYNAALANNFFYSNNLSGLTLNGTTAAGPVDPSIKWEETTMTNIGIDAGFLGDQITVSLEYYKNKSDDLLMNLPLTPSLRTLNGSVTKNVASVETSGIELSLGYNDYEGDFQWSVNANLSTTNNKVLDLGGIASITGAGFENQNISRTIVGESMFHFYGWEMEGIFQDAADVAGHATQNGNPQPGDVKFKDIAGPADENGNLTAPDGIIDDNDRTIIGNPFPDITYGISGHATYKGFDFDVFFQGVAGNEVFNTNIYDLQGMTRLFNSGVEVLDRWTATNPSNTIPRIGGIIQNTYISSRYVEDGSYLRLRNISVGYTIPSSVLNNKVSKIRIYASAQNLLTLTGYSGLDPEIAGGNTGMGIDRGSYPTPKSFTGGVQVTF
jgi:TonB-linked SusC/RagA family outer membrane protein